MNYIISSLTKFASNDIIFLLKNYSNLFFEIDLKKEPDDLSNYLEIIKHHCPKSKSVLNFLDVFLSEFKEDKIRDYIFDYVFFFDYIRVEDKIYEVTSDLKNYSTFFKILKNSKSYSSLELKDFENCPENYDYYIFKEPENELFSIKILETQLKKNSSCIN